MKVLITFVVIMAATLFLPAHVTAMETKTPADVFQRIMLSKQQVQHLRKERHIVVPWPVVEARSDLAPRHVFEKCLEVLDKIKRLRRSRNMGPIALPQFPTRDVTPNEVFDIAGRLLEELKLFPGLANLTLTPATRQAAITPSDVYREVSSISLALDPLLGVRGLTPTDVYLQSQKILEQVKFLRISQSQPLDTAAPQKTVGKHPNHSLQQTYKLMGEIAKAQHNLWIPPINVPTVPRREITPGEVHDALLIVQAELQRIKFRLGIEYPITVKKTDGQKNPDDVLLNLKWATQMMPKFTKHERIIQYPQTSLAKTPNHLYIMTEHIIRELSEYRRRRGINALPPSVPKQANLETHHIYQKTLQVLDKVNQIRKQEGLGELATSPGRVRKATLSEVYDLLLRLDLELSFIYKKAGMTAHDPSLALSNIHNDKTASDVFEQMQTLSHLLDAVLSRSGDGTNDAWKLSQRLLADIRIIATANNRTFENITLPTIKHSTLASDAQKEVFAILNIIKKFKTRIGLLESAVPVTLTASSITFSDVYNEMELVLSELENIKIFLNIEQPARSVEQPQNKTPGDVSQQLLLAKQMLLTFIE
ncbi:hypothetical protein ACFL2V_11625 [Pseudomonadota bacterium]